MTKFLPGLYLWMAFIGVFLLGAPRALASHIQGGQLTYVALGNDQYRVTLAVFRDCGGSAFVNIHPDLEYRTTGCVGPWPKVPMGLVSGSQRIGNPYCASAQYGSSPCAPGRPTNFETGLFEAVVTLPPAAEWTLSVTLEQRPELANAEVGSGVCYFEATLNNLVGGHVLENTSPQYEPQNAPIPFVCWRQDTQLSFATTDPDGDSLVYSLAPSLQACNDTVTYKSYASSRVIDLTPPGGTPCAAYIAQGATGTFKPTFPIPSFVYSGPCPLRTATPSFLFNPTLGTITFSPAFLAAGINQAGNKYAVVGKITEWRSFKNANGSVSRYPIGSVRREMLVVVIDCGSNLIPNPPLATSAAKARPRLVNSRDSTYIEAYTCNYTEVRLHFSDPNAGDVVTVSYPELDPASPTPLRPTYLPEDVATFQLLGNGTKTPAAILRIRPDIAFLGRSFRIPLKIEDSGCPIKGTTYRTIVVHIAKGNFATVAATGAGPKVPLICEGTPTTLRAEPARPDSVGQALAHYAYGWAPAPGLALADTARQTVTVRPTRTTRYHVRIVGLDFRQLPHFTCFDTASLLVRVKPALVASFTVTGRTLPGSSPNLPQRSFLLTNTSGQRADVQTVSWSYHRVKDSKGQLVADSAEVSFSTAFDPGELLINGPAGTYLVTLRLTGTSMLPCDAQTSVQTVLLPELLTPNVFTPNQDGLNDTFVLTDQPGGAGKVQIFNRWGRLIKQYDNYHNEWDGAGQPSGVYYYLVTGKAGATSKGWVELAR